MARHMTLAPTNEAFRCENHAKKPVSTIAKSSISAAINFCCILENFLLKNAIGLLS